MHPWAVLAAVGGAAVGFTAGGLAGPLIVMIILIRRGAMRRPRDFRRILSGVILLGLGAVLAGGSNVLSVINDDDRQSGVPFHVPGALVLIMDLAAFPCCLTGLVLVVSVLRRQRDERAGRARMAGTAS